MKSKIALALLTATLSASLAAAPAHWYNWRSKLNGQLFCAQTSPGEGWEKIAQPYKNSRCQTP